MPISQKVAARISAELKRYQPILASAKERDVSESNTVVIVVDMLTDIFGYDKYHEITTEHSIRGTYVDLAVAVDGDTRFLIEVKAIGIELKDGHVKQAIDYGANLGIEWIVLTNGAIWRVYKILFGQPIEKTLVVDIDVSSANPRNPELVECFGNLSREGFSQNSMTEFLQQKQVMSKFAIAAILQSDTLLEELRRELRRLSPGLKVDTEYLASTLSHEVIKRELVDGEDAKAAATVIKRLYRRLTNEKKKRTEGESEHDSSGPATTDKPTIVSPISEP